MSKKSIADLTLLAITIFWGASFPLMKNILEYIPAYAYITIRFFLAAAVLTVIFHKDLKKINKQVIKYGSIIGLCMFAGTSLQVVGLYTTSASNSAFITGLNVLIVPVIAAVMLKKKPDKASLFGIMIAFTGLFFLSGGVDFNFNIGDFLTFLCAICWAFQIIFIDKFARLADTRLLALVQVLFVGMAGLGLWILFDAGKPMTINGAAITILLITAVFGTALAFAGQTIAQKHTTPVHTSLILTAEPVFALIFTLIIPNVYGATERLTLTKAIGCLLILAGMLVSELKPGKCKKDNQVFGQNPGK
jgi:drug/metabolite transporter (DMT)-like permease